MDSFREMVEMTRVDQEYCANKNPLPRTRLNLTLIRSQIAVMERALRCFFRG